jgi:RHS repeat-associated protein
MNRAYLMILILLVVAAPLAAQNFQEGIIPFESYDTQQFDSVSLSSGNVGLDIPLISYPQKGTLPDVGYHLVSVSESWYQTCATDDEGYTECDWNLNTGIIGAGPINELGLSNCDWCPGGLGIMVTDSSGAGHPEGPTDFTLNGYIALDATGYKTIYNSGTHTFSTMDRNGISHVAATYGSTWIDPSGNTVTPITDPTAPGYTDSFGRTITAPTYQLGCHVTYEPGSGGGTVPFTFCYTSTTVSPDIGTSDAYMCTEIGSSSFGIWELQSVTLPNGTSWAFTYDSAGNLTSVTLPTGGTVTYTWQASGPTSCGYDGEIYYSAIDTRAVTPTSGGPTHTWTYTFPTVNSSTVTDPDGNLTTHAFLYSAYETETKYYSGTTSLLKTVDTHYFYYAAYDILPDLVTTTWPDGHVSAVCTIYDDNTNTSCTPGDDAFNSSGPTFAYPDWGYTWLNIPIVYGSPLYKYEYDYGSGSPGSVVRETDSHFLWQDSSTYLNANFLNLPAYVKIKDGGGTQVAYTTYNYDETLTGNYTACSPGPCGNQTTRHQWLNTISNYLVTTNLYNSTGQLVSTTDPNSNPATTYGYSSSSCTSGTGYAGTGPTSVTNALSQTTSSCYDLNTGVLLSTTDANSQTTTNSIDDMRRVTQINYPDGGEVTYTYTDTTPNPYVVFTKKITSSMNFTEQGTMDGLGRLIQTKTTVPSSTCSGGYAYADTTYDNEGRQFSVSNPYCTTGDPTYGLTRTYYDPLDRPISVVEQDGSAVSTSYSGPCKTITDEAGKARYVCADGVGRMASVTEDPGSGSHLNYSTTYSYNALSNLTGVTQSSSRTRTFVYDSLSRLTSAANPESGTTTYTYDADGNVATKTDARSITEGYVYDALNRLLEKYATGMPSIYYVYDQTSADGISLTYTIGRRTWEGTNDGTSWLTQAVFSYDKMGRPIAYIQCIGSSICETTNSYTYNYDGSYATITYPTGRTITYTPNVAEQIVSAVDSANSINYVTSAGYTPAGALASLMNGSTLLSSLYYNSRLQPCRIAVNSSGTAPSSCTSSNYGNVLDLSYNFNLGSSDNGNVMGITNNIDGTRSQTFTYDSLNRISTAETTSTYSTSAAHCWGESYTIDAWGNLTAITPMTSSYSGCTQESGLSISVGSTNQISTSGYGYDSAGNMTSAPPTGTTYTFNAENQMTQAATSSTTGYIYDADGRRVAKTASGSAYELYWYDKDGNVLEESDGSGTLQNEYVFFGGKRIARRDSSNNVFYYFADELGTSRTVVQSGSTSPCYDADFYPFGGERAYTTTCSQNYKFTGKERDSESGLDNFGARYNSSQMGRFMSPDPMGGHYEDPQTLNRYSYVRNNPLSLTDPTGLDFYQQCNQTDDNKQTCNTVQGYGKLTFYGTTDQNGKFNGTVTTSASLQDPNSGNTATVNQNGVQLTTGNGTSEGVFINGTPAADIQGSGKELSGFLFHVDASDVSIGTLDSGTFTYTGSRNQSDVIKALNDRGAFSYTAEKFGNPFHPGDLNFRFSSGAHPELFDYGPSPHLLVPNDPRATVPVGPGYVGPFHVDSHTGDVSHGGCALFHVGCQ